MRRNLTISFEDGFVAELDEARDVLSRGVFIELLLFNEKRRVAGEAPVGSLGGGPVVPVRERSPEPRMDSERPREAKAERLEVGRRVLGKPVQPRPIIQKRER